MVAQAVQLETPLIVRQLAPAAGIGLTVVAILLGFRWFISSSDLPERTIGWYYYFVIGSCLLLGWARPHVAALTAFALTPFNFGLAVPMLFTSAPATFLFAGAFLRIMTDALAQRRLPNSPLIPLAICLPLLTIFVVSFLNSFYQPNDFQVNWRLRLSEVLGLGLLSLHVLVPAFLGWSGREVVCAAVMLMMGIVFSVFLGLLGTVNTVFCLTPAESSSLLGIRFYRVIGGQSDPNLYGTTIAASIPFVYWSLVRHFGRPTFIVFLALALIAVVIVFSASRTAVATGLISVILSAVVAARLFAARHVLALAPAALILLASTTLWGVIPCTFARNVDIPFYSERNDVLEYFSRILQDLPDFAQRAHDIAFATEKELEMEFVSFRKSPELQRVFDADQARSEGWSAEAIVVEAIDWIGRAISLDSSRMHLWKHAAMLGVARPWLGWGPGNLSAMTPRGWRSHNSVLTLFAETGVLGAGAYLFPAVVLLVVMISSRRAAMREGLGPFLLTCVICVYIGSLAQDIYRAELLWSAIGLTTVWLLATSKGRFEANMRSDNANTGPSKS